MKNISIKKKIFFYLITLLILFLLFEILCRSFWAIRYNVPFFKMFEISYVFYPEVNRVKNEYQNSDKKKILLLGASVLNDDYGHVEGYLKDILNNENMDIYNVSEPAHTSLDSYYKYKLLKDMHFDAIVFYHGINETRANNCPDKMFSEDYNHYMWYKLVNKFFKHKEIPLCVSFYTMEFIFIRIEDKIGIKYFIPMMNEGKKEFEQYGGKIKTGKSFYKNLMRIKRLKNKRSDGKIIVPAFVFFGNKDFTKTEEEYSCPVGIWGNKENVKKGVYAHNKILYKIYTEDTNDFVWIDTYKIFPITDETMADVCHFTNKGSKIFASILGDTIKKYVK